MGIKKRCRLEFRLQWVFLDDVVHKVGLVTQLLALKGWHDVWEGTARRADQAPWSWSACKSKLVTAGLVLASPRVIVKHAGEDAPTGALKPGPLESCCVLLFFFFLSLREKGGESPRVAPRCSKHRVRRALVTQEELTKISSEGNRACKCLPAPTFVSL